MRETLERIDRNYVIMTKYVAAKAKAEKLPFAWGAMKKRILAFALTFLLVFTFVDSSVYSWDDESTRETLQGFDSMLIMVGELEPEIEKAGLTVDQLQTDVELKLQIAGIKLLSATECHLEFGRPYLSVNVTVLNIEDVAGYVYLVNISFFQKATMVREWNKNVSTWSTGYLGFTPHLIGIRNNVKDQVDIFINAWLSVNPEKKTDIQFPFDYSIAKEQ